MKVCMHQTGEEGVSKIKEKMVGIYEYLEQHLYERGNVYP